VPDVWTLWRSRSTAGITITTARTPTTTEVRGAVFVRVERRGPRSVVTRCSGSAPLAPRLLTPSRSWLAAVALVQTAGGPLGGDAVEIEVDVGPDAALDLRTIAATVVLRGPEPARQVVRARVADGARLRVGAEPVIVVAGARYESVIDVDLGADAAALVHETFVRGRSHEPGGAARALLRCDLQGRPLLRDAVSLDAPGAASDSPAVVAGARAYGSAVLLGVRAPATDPDECELAGPGSVLRVLADDAAGVAARLAAVRATHDACLLEGREDARWAA
jgi:urease accessory protein